MSEWWTYRPSSFLLFSPQSWYRLHERYNADVWPLQLVGLALGVAILLLARRTGAWRPPALTGILAAGWVWVAWAFHLQRYATINWAATYFAAAFVLEALLLILAGFIRYRATPARTAPFARRVGMTMLGFALVVQPAIGLVAGRSLAQSEFFGVAPDPTVVASLGVLLMLDLPALPMLLVIPLGWCAVSGALHFAMGAPDAWVLPLAGLVTLLTVAARRIPSRPSGAR